MAGYEAPLRGRGARDADVDALARALQVKARGRADGAADRPGADATELSAVEVEIIEACRAPAAACLLDAARSGDAAADTLRRLAPASAKFPSALADAEIAIAQVRARFAAERAALDQRAAQASADLAAFRAREGLMRKAIYPRTPALQMGLLLIAAVFEAMFSATLFASDDARGLLGGAATATGISGANVALGFLAGFLGLRYLQHRRRSLKAFGAACLVAFALGGLGLNLFAANWRQEASHHAAAAARIEETRRIDRQAEQCLMTAGSLRAGGGETAEVRQERRRAECRYERRERLALLDPPSERFSLTEAEPQAVVLLMLGLGVWVFAALKGYSGVDDPYPDYGKLDRAAADAEAETAALREDIDDAAGDVIESARSAAAADAQARSDALAAMRRAYDEVGARTQPMLAAATRWERAAEALLALYRGENRSARRTPAPAHFTAAAPRFAPDADPLDRPGRALAEAEARAREAEADAAAGLDRLRAQAEALLAPPAQPTGA